MPLPDCDHDHLVLYEGEKLLGPITKFGPDEDVDIGGAEILVLVVDANVDASVSRVDVYEEQGAGEKRLVCGVRVTNVSKPFNQGKPTRIVGLQR